MIVFLYNFGNLKFFINATISFIFESVQTAEVQAKLGTIYLSADRCGDIFHTYKTFSNTR